jgi:hypothetical protein
MNKTIISISVLALSYLTLSSCATIVGGSHYVAEIEVKNNPRAEIFYKDKNEGTQTARIRVLRREANKFSFVVKEKGCPDQTFNFRQRTFRGWALAGTILTWTGSTGVIPLPWGVVLDVATGALWKPDQYERYVIKSNYKTYRYVVPTAPCSSAPTNTVTPTTNEAPVEIKTPGQQPVNPAGNFEDVLYFKNGNIIHGFIIEQVPNDFVKIQSKEGNILKFNTSEIDRMTRELIQK